MLSIVKSALDDSSSDQRAKVAALALFLILVNIAVLTWAAMTFADRPTLFGTALLAYVLGLRHAVDADHIAAIDNVVRKLMQEGKRPISAGLFFSLGHSLAIAIAVAAIAGLAFALEGRLHAFKILGSIVGSAASAFFLLAVALINIFVLRDVWHRFRRMRRGEAVDTEEIDGILAGRGMLARIFRPLFGLISRSWQMAPLGFLFGLGFDTATEVSLFSVAAAHASGGATFATVMIFPALFAAGMALLDTADSVMMVGAYGWAFLNPIRRIWYNLTITAISVVVAVVIGGIEALQLIGGKLGLGGTFWQAVESLNQGLANFGYIVVALFVVCWAISYLLYRWQGLGRPSRREAET